MFGSLRMHCHTYNPPPDTSSSMDNGIAMFLGDKLKSDHTDYTYFVYFHEKGTFWTNKDVHDLRLIRLKLNEQSTLTFRKVFHSILPKPETPCNNEEDFDLTKCFKDFIAKKVGCSLDWFTTSDSVKKCNTMDKVKETFALMDWLQDEQFDNISKITGCTQKCQFYSYEMVMEKSMTIDWKTYWDSELYVYLGSDIVEEREEYYTFDDTDFLSAVGGYLGKLRFFTFFNLYSFLGLFLGWSILSVFVDVWKLTEYLASLCRKYKK